MHCKNCGTEVAEAAVACLKCGQHPSTGTKFCANCGAEAKENAVICTACGSSLTAAATSAGPQQTSEVVAGLLNWLWTGAAYFYLGQNMKGIVLCIVTLLVVFIDVVTCSVGLIIHIPYSIILIVDAVKLAGRKNRGEQIQEWQFF